MPHAGPQSNAAHRVIAQDALERLPHGEPFRFVDQIIELAPGEAGVGVWRVTGREAFFAGHFEGNPIVPGVLIGEALAQMSGIVGACSGGEQKVRQGMLAQIDLRFRQPAAPPADILLHAQRRRLIGALDQFNVRAMIGDVELAAGTLTLAYRERS